MESPIVNFSHILLPVKNSPTTISIFNSTSYSKVNTMLEEQLTKHNSTVSKEYSETFVATQEKRDLFQLDQHAPESLQIVCRQMLQKGIDENVFPGAVLLVGRKGKILFHEGYGNKWHKTSNFAIPTSMTADTVFDVASLTSGLVTSIILMKLIEQGKLKLDERVSRYIPRFSILGKSTITIGHLIAHTSGLPRWYPFYEDLVHKEVAFKVGLMTTQGIKDYIVNTISKLKLNESVGENYLYSDLGLIILGAIIEITTGKNLNALAFEHIFSPLALNSSSYIKVNSRLQGKNSSSPYEPITEMIAPTELCQWRKKILWGEVHDDNAWIMGGVAPQSGLFTSAKDIHSIVSNLLLSLRGQSNYLSQDTVRHFLKTGIRLNERDIKYGWDSPDALNGMIYTGLSDASFGINSFTGCSVWADPAQDLDIILLTNRINPSRDNKKILNFRPELYRAILSAI
jgi:CubicO group peptidase (beta-lactamase class C family)